MVDVTVETTIDRPVSVVAKYAADPTNAVHWWANVSAAAWQGKADAAVGSKFAFTASYGGRPVECLYEISEFTPGNAWSSAPSRVRSRWRRPTPGRPPTPAPG